MATVVFPTPPLPVTKTSSRWSKIDIRRFRLPRNVVVVAGADPVLRESYRTCRRLQRRHDPTFYAATSCLPRDVRPAVHALYGYVRYADEIADDPARTRDAAARRAALDAWQALLEDALATGRSRHPVVAALVDAGARHDLPLYRLPRYMDAMRVDCGPVRMRTTSELDDYMEGSAATVGRIMAPLLGAPPALAEDVARLGVAFQLANFVRDVRLDWELDRVYLPGLPEDDLRAGAATPRLRRQVAREVARARALFAETAGVGVALAPSMRTGVRLARAVYGRVLDRIERNGFDVLERRARLAPWEATGAVAGALVGAGR
ncbi:MAG TPA: phytoene/squalene synthase family protein [Solirubrobacteraceae bacterium]|jgi:phytoene synthase|nr:phytoene/squalene synthase family protein [Solirubrobacteraceae bacterium]